ncbi:MAG: phosphopantothenoylcysteine decarboxylase [Candidatus Omnitrophica bacterium]|nr:phosphopantothenoylcysteine decarboxylase [Candidatus Omnitrophota bacterium]
MKSPLVLVTAGPTREKIDPIRFISNYSTGMFGYKIAEEARDRGCRVVLVTGPVSIEPPSGVKTIQVESAIEMQKAVKTWSNKADYIFMAAAVSDWRAADPARAKIKKIGRKMSLELKENPDILKTLGKRKTYRLVGFALETENLIGNAAKKLKNKGLDIIVANRLTKNANLFGDNKIDVLIMDRYGGRDIYKGLSKGRLSKIILDKAFSFNIK